MLCITHSCSSTHQEGLLPQPVASSARKSSAQTDRLRYSLLPVKNNWVPSILQLESCANTENSLDNVSIELETCVSPGFALSTFPSLISWKTWRVANFDGAAFQTRYSGFINRLNIALKFHSSSCLIY